VQETVPLPCSWALMA
jgi:hypothetical protein